jgi:hypothetical protein
MSRRESLTRAGLGADPEALSASVSLATPLTMNRLVGRDRAAGVLREFAEANSIAQPDFVWKARNATSSRSLAPPTGIK